MKPLWCLFALATLTAGLAFAEDAAPTQGVKGRVSRLMGNQMPGPGRPPDPGQPLSVPVHVFRGQVKPFAGPAAKHAAFVATVKSDKGGNYQVPLPAGVYTVVIEFEGQLYLNLFDGAGCWGSVTVKAGEWARWDIVESASAAF